MAGGTHTTETALAGIQVQTSLLSQPITIGWGRGRLSCNLIDYVGFQAIAATTVTGGGKGGSSTNTTYTYTASPIMALCEGAITGVRTVYRDASVFTDGGTTALAQAGLSLATGGITQSPWAYMTSMFPTHALGYSSLAYVYAQDYALSGGASLPNHGFEVDFAIQFGTNGDADPKDIVNDFLTNVSYGVTGWGSGLIGSWSDMSLYCRASNLLLSPVLDSAGSGTDFLDQIAKETNSDFFWSEGVLKWKSYGDTAVTGNSVTWTPNLTPIYDLNEDDFLEEVTLEIVDQTDAYNYVQVEYLDRSNQYQTATAIAQDLDNIVTYGLRKRDPEQFHHICDSTIAQMVVQLRLQRTLYIRDRYTFKLPEDFVAIEPMDYLTLSSTVDGMLLNRQLVLVESIDEDEQGDLTVTAIGIPGQTAHAALYTAHTSGGYQPAVDVAPGNVTTPFIFTAPKTLAKTSNEIWCAVSGGANWGGCYVWMSVDNVSYSRIGTISQPARYGVASASLASHADPDSTNTLSVDLTLSNGSLVTVSHAQADQDETPCLVDDEIVDFGTATLTAAYKYNLTYLRRARLGSTVAAHSTNAPFIRLDNAIFKYAYPSSALGTTVYLKFQSFNHYGRGVQDLSTLSPTSFVVSPTTVIPDSFGLSIIGQLIASSRVSGLTISSTSSTISISAHTRIYADKSVSVSSGTCSATSVATTAYIYYDDEARTGGSVTYHATTTFATAQESTSNPFRHYVGQVVIPASGTNAGTGPVNSTPVAVLGNMSVNGYSVVTVAADYTGAITAALPVLKSYTMFVGGTDVTTSAAWTVTTLTGTIAASIGAATGILSLNTSSGVMTSSTLRITAAYGGATPISFDVNVVVQRAAAPTSGSSGGTSDSSSFSGSCNSTTMVAVSGTLTVTTGSGGQVDLNASYAFSNSQTSGSYKVYTQWYRWNGSSWVALGSAVLATDPYLGASGTEGDGYCNYSATGLGASTSQQFQLWAKDQSGSVTNNLYGDISAVGS